MSEDPQLAPSALEHLRQAYARYETAQLGELNVTAEELREVCKMLGWTGAAGEMGPRVWARRKLGIEP